MTPEERNKHEYLGDAVYAEYDGYHIILRTEDHRDFHCNNKIFLDSDVLHALNRFVERMRADNGKKDKIDSHCNDIDEQLRKEFEDGNSRGA